METFTNKNWQDFINGKIAVNCKTEELAREFINGEKIKKIADWNGNTYWSHYKENMTYSKISKLGFCDKGYYVNQGLIIKEFKGWDEFNFNAEEFKQRFIELRQAMQQRVVEFKQKDWVDRVQKFTSLMIELRNPELTKEQKYDIEAEICMMFMAENK
jgi:hypothetical protein